MDPTAPQRRTLEGLIGLGKAPDMGIDLADLLRARLDKEVRAAGVDRSGWTARRPLWLGKGSLSDRERCGGLFLARITGETPPFEHSSASGAGVLFHKAIEIDVASERACDVRSVCERAALRLVDGDRSFGSYWSSLDELDRAELVAESERRLVLFRDSFPPLPRRWHPQAEFRVHARLGGGRVVLSGAPDLVLGRGRRLIIDLKTGGAWPEHAEDARFYALLLLLRTGLAPYRVATFFVQSGEWQAEDVTEQTLHHASDRVIQAVRSAVRLQGGVEPDLTPGAHCSWCVRAPTCPASVAGPIGGGESHVGRVATAR